jgi:hypothetical protein
MWWYRKIKRRAGHSLPALDWYIPNRPLIFIWKSLKKDLDNKDYMIISSETHEADLRIKYIH